MEIEVAPESVSGPDSAPAPPSAGAGHALDVTLLRTSCLLIEYGGLRILTDPFFHRTMRGLPIFRPPGIPLERVGRIDIVVASHLHRDHFDLQAVRQLAHPQMVLVGCPGTAAFCAGAGLPRIVEIAPWQETTVGDVRLTATPADHTGPPPAEVNVVIRLGPWRIFFGGDARYSEAFTEIGERLGPIDVALLPIGGTRIFGQRTTMDPADAVRACADLRPRWAVPIHEGGEWLPVPPASWHPGRFHHFVTAMQRSGQSSVAVAVEPGETARFVSGDADSGVTHMRWLR